MLRAFRVVLFTGMFPETVLIPANLIRGLNNPNRIAKASVKKKHTHTHREL